MKVYKFEVMVLDHEDSGIEAVQSELENVKFSAPRIMSAQTAEIDWVGDETPINKRATVESEFRRLFPVDSSLKARIAQLESYLPKTKDGKLVVECENLYCPTCGNTVRHCGGVNFCDECPNPDDGNEPPLPLFDSSCLSSSMRSALKERLEKLVGTPLKFDSPEAFPK